MTLQQLLLGQFGVSASDVNETFPVVGTTPVQLLTNNPNRVGFIIVNLSTNTAYVGLQAAVTTTTGAALGGNQSFSSTWRDDFNSVGFARYAVAATSNNNFYVAEIVLTGNEQPQVGGSSAGI